MNNLKTEDSLLISNYISGDEYALEILIKKHQTKIFSFIYSKTFDRDLSNDIFQDAFIKVINTLKTNSYNEEGKFLPWVLRITHNLVIDHFRRIKKMPFYRETEDFSIFSIMSDNSVSIENKLIKQQIDLDLQKLIKNLPSEQREVILMRMYHDLSFKEIADLTGVTINAALGRMRYALQNIRKNVDKNKIILLNQ
jgi:RNA polymerase sigma-70 factor (ECF subfamily)